MTYQEANALVDDFSFVYKGKSISKEALIECREIIHKALEKQIPKSHIKLKNTNKIIGIVLFAGAIWEMIWNCNMLVYSQNSVNIADMQ